MREMKLWGSLCLLMVLLLVPQAAAAAERVPLRIARLPVQVRCNTADVEAVKRM